MRGYFPSLNNLEAVQEKKEGRRERVVAWREVGFAHALQLGKVHLYSFNEGRQSIYFLGKSQPNKTWRQLDSMPSDARFEFSMEAKRIRLVRRNIVVASCACSVI